MYLLGAAVTAVAVAGVLPTAASAHTAATAAATTPTPVVVVSGLNNPRQLSVAGGQLYIAEAGRGGKTVYNDPDEGPTYIGDSGSISLVTNPATASGTTPNRVVTGLISGAGEDGSFAAGADGVSVPSTGGPIYIQETYAPPDVFTSPLGSAEDGALVAATAHVKARTIVANITDYEQANDPDGQGFDSNPYAVLAVRTGEYVADAAGNDVLFVNKAGHISTFHVFPNVTTGACASQYDPTPAFPGCDFVPTSLARDSSGHLFVGGLSSLTPGEAQVLELNRTGSVVKAFTGFTGVTGVAVAPNGTLYVSQLFADEANPPFPGIQGVLTKILPNGTRTDLDVPFPAGVAVDAGNVYVAAWSVAPATGLAGPGTSGQVWRLKF